MIMQKSKKLLLMNIVSFTARGLELATSALLPALFKRSFFRSALYRYLTTVQVQGAPRLFVDPFECIGASILVDKQYYESHGLAAFKGYVNELSSERTLFVDVGANLGNHLVALESLYEKAIAFEPVAFNYYLCLANIHYNHLSSKVIVHSVALGDAKGQRLMQLPAQSPYLKGDQRNNGMYMGTNHLQSPTVDAMNDECYFTVRAERGDCMLREAVSGFKRIVIKIDCEGAEVEVLNGLSNLFIEYLHVDFVLLLEVLAPAALANLILFLDNLQACSRRQHHIEVLNNGRFSEFTGAHNQIKLPQSMLLVRLPANKLAT